MSTTATITRPYTQSSSQPVVSQQGDGGGNGGLPLSGEVEVDPELESPPQGLNVDVNTAAPYTTRETGTELGTTDGTDSPVLSDAVVSPEGISDVVGKVPLGEAAVTDAVTGLIDATYIPDIGDPVAFAIAVLMKCVKSASDDLREVSKTADANRRHKEMLQEKKAGLNAARNKAVEGQTAGKSDTDLKNVQVNPPIANSTWQTSMPPKAAAGQTAGAEADQPVVTASGGVDASAQLGVTSAGATSGGGSESEANLKDPNGSLKTVGDIDLAVDSLTDKIDSASALTSQDATKIQSAMSNLTELQNMITNMMKNVHDTRMSIIRNIA